MSGASRWFNQGWIVYSNKSKTQQLGVDESYFSEENIGAVSHEVAIGMARGARYKSNSDVSIGITGIAGPTGSSENKEVGRVHVAIIAKDYFLVRRMDFGDNDRLDNKKSFASFALGLALEALDKVDSKNSKTNKISNKDKLKKSSEEIDISSLDSLLIVSSLYPNNVKMDDFGVEIIQENSGPRYLQGRPCIFYGLESRNRLINKIDRYYHERYYLSLYAWFLKIGQSDTAN